MIDLHWALGPRYFPYGPPAEFVWNRAVRYSLEGGEVLTMGPIDTILFLAAHGTKHGWAILGSVCDLAAALGGALVFNSHQLLDEAAQFGCLNMLLLGAALAHNLLGAPIPSVLADRIAGEPAIGTLAIGVERRMFKYVGVRAASISTGSSRCACCRIIGAVCAISLIVPSVPLPKTSNLSSYPPRSIHFTFPCGQSAYSFSMASACSSTSRWPASGSNGCRCERRSRRLPTRPSRGLRPPPVVDARPFDSMLA